MNNDIEINAPTAQIVDAQKAPGLPKNFLNTVWQLVSCQAGTYIECGANNGDRISANGQNGADPLTLFQFIEASPGVVHIWCLHHAQFLSGVGDGWPLLPKVFDMQWSFFTVQSRGDHVITIKSTVKQDDAPLPTPFVSVYGDGWPLRIAEAKPLERWSFFLLRKPLLSAPAIADLIARNSYRH